MVADFDGLTDGAGDVALDPTLLPQSEGTALLGVPLLELASCKLAQLHLVGLAATLGACEGLATGLPVGLAAGKFSPLASAAEQSLNRSSGSSGGVAGRASAITCGGTIIDELTSARFATSLSELGLSGSA